MKKFLIILAIAALGASGCDRTIESNDPIRSVPVPTPAPTNIRVLVNAESIDLDWTVTDSSNVAKYRIYVADTLPQDFRRYDSSTSSTATLTDLLINRLYYIRIVGVDPNGLEGESSSPVSAVVGYASIDINGDAVYTRSQNVVITFNSSALVSQVIFSEDSAFTDAVFIPYATTRNFTLTLGDGPKTVYAKLVFVDGSQSGELLEDRITLDTQAAIDSVFMSPSATTFTPGQVITFGLDAGDIFGRAAVSFTGVTSLELFDDGTNGDNIQDDGVYHGVYEVPVSANLYRDVVTGFFTDAAGNTALPIIANELLNINTPPDAVDLGLTVNVLGEYEFTWTLSLEPDFESYRLYSNSTPTIDTNSTLVTIVTNPLVSLYVAPAPSTTMYYRLFVFDQHGAVAGSNVVQ